jgi:hypothetical protein
LCCIVYTIQMLGGRGRGGGSGGGSTKVVRNNHLIQCYIYKNIALFKGDTYVYRGIFKRNGGEFQREHYGYAVSLENWEKVKEEVSKMVSGFIIYKREHDELNVKLSVTNLLDDTSSVNECSNNTSDNLVI